MIDEKVTAGVLAILIASGLFATSQTIFAGRVVEPFSELAILGPNMKIGDYPSELVVGQPFKLYLYLGNHEGKTMFYRVCAKLGDKDDNVSDVSPLDVPSIAYYETIIMHEGNVTMPIELSLSDTGINKRLVFELHCYDRDVGGFKYCGQWCQLWLNVTRSTT